MPHRIPKSALLASAARRDRARKATILVAEDSADAREMMQVLLETKGYDVVSAGDGIGAVDVALHELPDLIMIDLELPYLDGLAVTRELRLHHETARVPIIIVSGHDPSRYRNAALTAGCDDYLLKPVDFDRLDKILHERIPTPLAQARTA
jgi:DNA-binding response OmpR family regulator